MLGTLEQLMDALFAPSGLAQNTTIAPAVAAAGKGTARAIERYCERSLVWASARVEEFRADCYYAQLRAAPVTGPFPTVEISLENEVTRVWRDIRSNVAMCDAQAGLLHFKSPPGTSLNTLRVTYAGGYWLDPTPDRTGTPPDGLTALPDDIFTAWVQLTQEVWTRQQQRLAATADPGHFPSPAEFPQIVRDLLAPYRRLAA